MTTYGWVSTEHTSMTEGTCMPSLPFSFKHLFKPGNLFQTNNKIYKNHTFHSFYLTDADTFPIKSRHSFRKPVSTLRMIQTQKDCKTKTENQITR